MPESKDRIDALREAIEAIGRDRPVRVLLVDDDHDDRELVRVLLAQYPIVVDVCDSGESALERMTSSKFDIIFLDVKLPGMDGIATFSEIKTAWPNSRVFFITGYPDFPGLNAALDMGVIRVIGKSALASAFKELFAALCPTKR